MDYGGFDSALLTGILRGSTEQRFDLQILSIQRDKLPDESYTQFFMRKGIRGAILRITTATRDIGAAIADEGFPAVIAADHFDQPNANFAWTDSRDAFRRAVDHLLDLGHRRIALGVHSVPDTDHADRRVAFETALAVRKIPFDAELRGEFVANMDGGASFVSRMMSLPHPPTAIVFTDPLSTFGAVRRCHELGVRVPDDLSIIGFDDSDLRKHMFPVCTSVCQDAETLGFEAARWLTRRLSGRNGVASSLRLILPAALDVHHSTAAPPENAVRVLPDGTRVNGHISPPASNQRSRSGEVSIRATAQAAVGTAAPSRRTTTKRRTG
jgi:DNA-binding LacI/PurR family transcriptional regulator